MGDFDERKLERAGPDVGSAAPPMIRASTLLAVDTALEGATGFLLIAAPGVVATLLFAAGLEGAGVAMGRLAGIALFSLSLACWIGRTGPNARAALAGMGAFNMLATVYLAGVGFAGQTGILLWPMVLVHAAVTILIARLWTSGNS